MTPHEPPVRATAPRQMGGGGIGRGRHRSEPIVLSSRRLCHQGRDGRRLTTTPSNVMLTAALHFAELGLDVFPCGSDKRPYTDNGHLDATTDPDMIEGWWWRWPHANIGHRPPKGVVIIDVDTIRKKTYDPGYKGFDDWTRVGPDGADYIDPFLLPLTDEERERCLAAPIVQSPREGVHFHLADPDGVFSCTTGRLAPNIDTKTSDGYVLLPPSEVVFRRRDRGEVVGSYRWVSRPLGEIKPQLVPDTLVTLFKRTRSVSARARTGLGGRHGASRISNATNGRAAPGMPPHRRGRYSLAALEGEYEAVLAAPEGTRNDTLNRAAFNTGTLIGARVLDAADAAVHLYEAAIAVGLPHHEAVATIRSGLAAGVARPRWVD